MKCTFAAREPNLLMEANTGDLFVPLGPDLVDCVCAVRSRRDVAGAIDIDVPREIRLDPRTAVAVVVLGCRVEKGEPEHYPPGFQTFLPGATPISFLEQVEPAAFRERGQPGNAKYWNVEITVPSPRDRAAANACVDSICAAVNASFDTTDVPVSRL